MQQTPHQIVQSRKHYLQQIQHQLQGQVIVYYHEAKNKEGLAFQTMGTHWHVKHAQHQALAKQLFEHAGLAQASYVSFVLPPCENAQNVAPLLPELQKQEKLIMIQCMSTLAFTKQLTEYPQLFDKNGKSWITYPSQAQNNTELMNQFTSVAPRCLAQNIDFVTCWIENPQADAMIHAKFADSVAKFLNKACANADTKTQHVSFDTAKQIINALPCIILVNEQGQVLFCENLFLVTHSNESLLVLDNLLTSAKKGEALDSFWYQFRQEHLIKMGAVPFASTYPLQVVQQDAKAWSQLDNDEREKIQAQFWLLLGESCPFINLSLYKVCKATAEKVQECDTLVVVGEICPFNQETFNTAYNYLKQSVADVQDSIIVMSNEEYEQMVQEKDKDCCIC